MSNLLNIDVLKLSIKPFEGFFNDVVSFETDEFNYEHRAILEHLIIPNELKNEVNLYFYPTIHTLTSKIKIDFDDYLNMDKDAKIKDTLKEFVAKKNEDMDTLKTGYKVTEHPLKSIIKVYTSTIDFDKRERIFEGGWNTNMTGMFIVDPLLGPSHIFANSEIG